MKTVNIIVGCMIEVIVISGCVTESRVHNKCADLCKEIHANLASGDTDKIERAFDYLNRSLLHGKIRLWAMEEMKRTRVPISLEDRLMFVNCASLNYLLKETGFPFLDYDSVEADEGGVIKSKILEYGATLLSGATEEQKEEIFSRIIHNLHNHGYVNSIFLKKLLPYLDAKKLYELRRYCCKREDIREDYVDEFLKKAHSADELYELCIELGSDKSAARTKVEAALLLKVHEIKKETTILRWCQGDKLKYLDNPKLIVKMISLLSDKQKMKLADYYLSGNYSWTYKAYYWWRNPPSYNLLNYGVVCALTAKDTGVAKSISDLILRKLEECRDYVPQNGAKWGEEHDKMAYGIIKRLISVAGDDWLESVLSRNKDCPSFVIVCATSSMANRLLSTSKIQNSKTYAALAKIATIDMKKFEENQVSKILSNAKHKENSTFVLNGFYLGMPIEDAYVLLRYYFPESKITIVPDGKTKGRSIEIDSVKSDEVKEGEATDMYFCQAGKDGHVYRFSFNKKILKKWFRYDVQTYREWALMFGKQYNFNFRLYTPKDESSFGSIYIKVQQESYRYKNNLQDYVVTYFGKINVYDPNEQGSQALMRALQSGDNSYAHTIGVEAGFAEGVRKWIKGGGWANAEGGKEGTLRIEAVKD